MNGSRDLGFVSLNHNIPLSNVYMVRSHSFSYHRLQEKSTMTRVIGYFLYVEHRL